MVTRPGLEVVVKGDLPKDVLNEISAAVQRAVRNEVAAIDMLSDYTEQPSSPASVLAADFTLPGLPGHILGIIFNPPSKAT